MHARGHRATHVLFLLHTHTHAVSSVEIFWRRRRK
jgi:hypothetical protein